MLSEVGIRGLEALVSLALPPVCILCERECDEGHDLCPGCDLRAIATTPVMESGVRGVGPVLAGGAYSGIAGDLVRALKFSRRIRAAGEAAGLIERAIARLHPTLLEERPMVVPVPPSPVRWLVRGFDSAEETALELSRRLDLPFGLALVRTHGPRQTGRGRFQRLAEPPLVSLSGSAEPLPGGVLLIDDVFTTGSTLAACAEPLLSAGASTVSAACIARAG